MKIKARLITAALVAAVGLSTVAACGAGANDADVASQNISTEADNFKINRRIIAVNAFTDKYIMTVEGFCNIKADRADHQLEVTCKVGDKYKKNFVGLADNTFYFVEQLEAQNVSTSHYEIVFKPSVVIPDVEVK